MNNSSNSSLMAVDLHHQIVDNERFMMKYATGLESHQRSKPLNDESSTTASVFADQNRSSKKPNLQSGILSIIHITTSYTYIYIAYF